MSVSIRLGKDRGHAGIDLQFKLQWGRTQVRMDIVGCPDMRWGHGRAKKTGTWSDGKRSSLFTLGFRQEGDEKRLNAAHRGVGWGRRKLSLFVCFSWNPTCFQVGIHAQLSQWHECVLTSEEALPIRFHHRRLLLVFPGGILVLQWVCRSYWNGSKTMRGGKLKQWEQRFYCTYKMETWNNGLGHSGRKNSVFCFFNWSIIDLQYCS